MGDVYAGTNIGRQIFRLNDSSRDEEDKSFDRVGQLADIARPRMSDEELQRLGGEGFWLLTRKPESVKKVLDEPRDILFPVPERRDRQGDHIEAKEEVFPEATGVELLLKILVGGAKNPSVHAP